MENPSVLLVMSQEAYTKYAPALRKGGLLLLDEDLVKPDKRISKMFAILATRIAREMGKVAVANIVMLGFLTAIAGLVSVESMKQPLLKSGPGGTEELNMKAFECGYNVGLEAARGKPKPRSQRAPAVRRARKLFKALVRFTLAL